VLVFETQQGGTGIIPKIIASFRDVGTLGGLVDVLSAFRLLRMLPKSPLPVHVKQVVHAVFK
jgi:hypothetical protein